MLWLSFCIFLFLVKEGGLVFYKVCIIKIIIILNREVIIINLYVIYVFCNWVYDNKCEVVSYFYFKCNVKYLVCVVVILFSVGLSFFIIF